VETEPQLDFLRARRCDIGQGFRFGKGGTVEELMVENYRYGNVEPWDNGQPFKGPPDAGFHRLRVANS
jgi:EAL domain-containing protein (putative c-di-GMP-specific phosphodiesterase class I)